MEMGNGEVKAVAEGVESVVDLSVRWRSKNPLSSAHYGVTHAARMKTFTFVPK